MKKLFSAAAIATMMASSSSAAVVDAFNLDVTSGAGTDSNVALDAGVSYILTVSGTFYLGSNPSRHLADAEYFNLGGTTPNPIDRTSREIGVGVDGQDVNFGAYDPSNTYTAWVVGDGSTINVFFADSGYGDNSGSLQVTLSSVPVPASAGLMLTALGGLAFARRRR